MSDSTLLMIGAVAIILLGVAVWFSRRTDAASKKEALTLPVTPLGGVSNTDAPVLALFHATWCPACQAFLPVWKAISGSLGRGAIEFEHSTTPNMQEYGIAGFPTVRLYTSGCAPGKPYIEYSGPRTYDGVMSFFTSGGAGSPPPQQPVSSSEPTVEHFETRLPGNFGSNMLRGKPQSPPVASPPGRKPRKVSFAEAEEESQLVEPVPQQEDGPSGFLPRSLPGSRYQTFAQLGELPDGVSV